jgi:hypothetical protein
MDPNDTGRISFKDLSSLLGLLLKGDHIEKITLFYKCHIPPVFHVSDIDESSIDNDISGK